MFVSDNETFKDGAVFEGARDVFCFVGDGGAGFVMRDGSREGVPPFGQGEVKDHAYIYNKEDSGESQYAT